MASNSFGEYFRITTWGESHGKAIGVVIDGCPAGLEICKKEIQKELDRRAPGKSPHTSPRKEEDGFSILSGLFEGKTTGAPLAIQLQNKDVDSSKYEPIKELLRPGHANATYLRKYGIFDHRGGGRASARETACRVVAGAIARQLLKKIGVTIQGELIEAGGQREEGLWQAIEQARDAGDSVGGVVEVRAQGIPVGWGDPVYRKLPAVLAYGILSIPACKGIEFGEGFSSAQKKGTEFNDPFLPSEEDWKLGKNSAGGTLGGISSGEELVLRAAFKPTSSIRDPQKTVDTMGRERSFQIPEGSRHDPCVAVRAVPVVEAMTALVLVDLWEAQKRREI